MRARSLAVFVVAVLVQAGLWGGAPAGAQVADPLPSVVCQFWGVLQTGGGSYSIDDATVICGGLVLGVCNFESTGLTSGGFAGAWNMAPCSTTGQSCNGTLGGSTGAQGPEWSYTAGPLLVASLHRVNCTPVLGLPGISYGGGLLSAVAVSSSLDLSSSLLYGVLVIGPEYVENPVPPI